MTRLDTETLRAALVGCQHQIDDIQARMAEIRGALGVKTKAKAGAPTVTTRRKISAAGRARIAAAQRKRWAESRPQARPVKAKRRLSAAGRAAIVAATKKRWDAVRDEKARAGQSES